MLISGEFLRYQLGRGREESSRVETPLELLWIEAMMSRAYFSIRSHVFGSKSGWLARSIRASQCFFLFR
jgi:hypothetical protein